jgi:hypothetical protein
MSAKLQSFPKLIHEYNYSYLKASTGFIFEALYAGTAPEITPIRTASASPKIISPGETEGIAPSPLVTVIPIIGKRAEISTPRITPKIPPTKPTQQVLKSGFWDRFRHKIVRILTIEIYSI